MRVTRLCQEEEHGLNENCVQYCIFSSLLLSTVLACLGFSSYYLVVQRHRLGKIMYKPMWLSHCTKIFPLLTSELICVTEKLNNKINCTKNERWLLFLTRGLWSILEKVLHFSLPFYTRASSPFLLQTEFPSEQISPPLISKYSTK